MTIAHLANHREPQSRRSSIHRLILAMIMLAMVCGGSPRALAAIVGRNFVAVNTSPGGVSDFGNGLHAAGTPGAGLVEWDYTTPIGPGELTATAHVVGTLYFDKICLNAFLLPTHCHGDAHVRFNFLNGNHGLLGFRDFDVNDAPGNNANDPNNQTPIDFRFPSPHVQIVQIVCDGVGKEVVAPTGKNNADIFANSGTVFFGGPSFGDAPLILGDGAIAGIVRQDATMNGGVIGTLYWNSSRAGNAMLRVAFARRDGVSIQLPQQFLLRNAPGGDPNSSQNKLSVPLPNFFTDPQLFQIRMTVGEASIAPSGFASFIGPTALNVFTFTGNVTGNSNLSPSYPTVASGEEQDFLFQWIVHEGEVWRDLKTLEFRLRDGQVTALWIRWNEAANTFQLCGSRSQGGHGEDGDGQGPANDVRCGRELPPGSEATFETPFARLDLWYSSVTGSGPAGRSVALNLAVSFKPSAAGHTFTTELAATDDLGGQDDFFPAGSVTVQPDGHGEGRGD